MGAYQDYLDLRMAVAETVGRNDISDVMPRMVKLAESYFNKELRVKEMEVRSTVTFTNGLAALPSDYLEVKVLYDASKNAMRGNTEETVRSEGAGGSLYSIGNNGIYIDGLTGVTLDIVYYGAIPTLTASPVASNWLLQKCENLYVYAVSVELAKFFKDVDLVTKLSSLIDFEMTELRRAEDRSRFANAVIRPIGRSNP